MKDTQEILICPACGKEMDKVEMHNEGLFLDVCLKGCGGIYFDNRELAKFDENAENVVDLSAAYEGKTFQEVDRTMDRVCPKCGRNFIKNFVSARKEIEIDDCYSCGGKFLDFGELEKMRAQYENTQERVNDVVSYVYTSHGQEIMSAGSISRQKSGLHKLFTSLTGFR